MSVKIREEKPLHHGEKSSRKLRVSNERGVHDTKFKINAGGVYM